MSDMDIDSPMDPLSYILTRPTPFCGMSGKLQTGTFEPGYEKVKYLETCKILVIGAGGLGCEILKNLALSGFKDITVIDMDNIDVSNLNRQFLFRAKDVGRPKCEVAAEFIQNRVKGVKVTPHNCPIQDFDEDFYRQFKMVIAGLDNIEARRWLNAMLIGLVEEDDDEEVDPETIIPMIDGGTEGFRGQARVIIPRFTPCYECTVKTIPPQNTFPLCTIAETPRKPEHCVSYAFILQWPEVYPDKKLDADNSEHIQWVYEKAVERAEKYKIQGVTLPLTLGVVKNIIPAVASTNAIISASCVNEALKLATLCSQTVNNYFMFFGNDRINSPTVTMEKEDDCLVCGATMKVIEIEPQKTLQELIDVLIEDPNLQLKKPSLATEDQNLYFRGVLEEQTKPNLKRKLCDLLNDEDTLNVTDPTCPTPLYVEVRFKKLNMGK